MAEKKKGAEAYKGTISSVILSLFVLFLFLVPVFTANAVNKVRKGDGKYDFQETMCFDINDEDQFEDDPDVSEDCGEGALGYGYDEGNGGGFSLNEITMMDYPLNGTVDDYAVGIVSACPNGEPSSVECSIIMFFLTITKEDIITLDVTRIDIFINATGIDDECEYEVYLSTIEDCPDGMELGEVTAGELTEIEIDINDILEINAFEEDEGLVIVFVPTEEECVIQPDSTVIYDMQFYNIEEVKVPSLTKIGIWMLAISSFMLFCAYLMLPQVTFDGVVKSLRTGLGKVVK